MSTDTMEEKSVSDLVNWSLKIVIAVEIFIVGVLILFGLLTLSLRLAMRRVLSKPKDSEKGFVEKVSEKEEKYLSEAPGPAFCAATKIKMESKNIGTAPAHDPYSLNVLTNVVDSKLGAHMTHHIYYKGKKINVIMMDVFFDDLDPFMKHAIAKANGLEELSTKKDATKDEKISAEVAALQKAVSTVVATGRAMVMAKDQTIALAENVKGAAAKISDKDISTNSVATNMALAKKIQQTKAKIQAFKKELSAGFVVTPTKAVEAGSGSEDHGAKTVAPVAKML